MALNNIQKHPDIQASENAIQNATTKICNITFPVKTHRITVRTTGTNFHLCRITL